MAIQLNPKYKMLIEKFVSNIDVRQWITVLGLPEYRPLLESVYKIHKVHISEEDANTLLADLLVTTLPRLDRDGVKGLLSEEKNKQHLYALVNSIQELIESLPWDMTVHFSLPKFENLSPFRVQLGDIMSLQFGMDNAPKMPRRKGLADLLNVHHEEPVEDCAWLSIKVRGFGDFRGDSAAVSQAMALAKQCNFFLRKFCRSGWTGDAGAYIETPKDSVRLSVPHAFRTMFASLTPSPTLLSEFYPSADLLDHLDKRNPQPIKMSLGITNALATAGRFFALKADGDVEAIGAAIEWYMDSVSAENETFGYLAACIGLEAILTAGDGADRLDNLSARLSDRYGFLMGVGAQDRKKLSDEYRSLLNLRGKLVHARRRSLKANEQDQLHRVRYMLSSVIDKEVTSLLSANEGASPVVDN